MTALEHVTDVTERMRAARRILVFTGAGVSTGSGIADFRGPDGLWKRRAPVQYADFMASEEKRVEHWDYKADGWESFVRAEPNATHRAIAKLETLGRVCAVVTQNIDGLHQRAGSSAGLVVEVHGTNREVECQSCGARSDPEPAMAAFKRTRIAPRCPCGGPLKLATISFGQALRPEVIARAFEAAAEADLVLALGSTLSVHPAASVPLEAVRRGAPYVIVNRGATDHDAIATMKIDDDVAAVIPAAVDAIASSP